MEEEKELTMQEKYFGEAKENGTNYSKTKQIVLENYKKDTLPLKRKVWIVDIHGAGEIGSAKVHHWAKE